MIKRKNGINHTFVYVCLYMYVYIHRLMDVYIHTHIYKIHTNGVHKEMRIEEGIRIWGLYYILSD